MVNAIPAPFTLTSGQSIILYQSRLPERLSVTLPVLEVSIDKDQEPEPNPFKRQNLLIYDQHGRPAQGKEKGLVIDTYF